MTRCSDPPVGRIEVPSNLELLHRKHAEEEGVPVEAIVLVAVTVQGRSGSAPFWLQVLSPTCNRVIKVSIRLQSA